VISPDFRSKLASTDEASLGDQADALVELIAPLLANKCAELQGAVVCDLAALWLAGHRVEHGRAAGDRMREELLQMHLRHVRELVELYLGGVDG